MTQDEDKVKRLLDSRYVTPILCYPMHDHRQQ